MSRRDSCVRYGNGAASVNANGEIMKSVSRIIKNMGASYVCHPSNYVGRLAEPRVDSVNTDIRATFERFRAEQSKQASNVRKIVASK